MLFGSRLILSELRLGTHFVLVAFSFQFLLWDLVMVAGSSTDGLRAEVTDAFAKIKELSNCNLTAAGQKREEIQKWRASSRMFY